MRYLLLIFIITGFSSFAQDTIPAKDLDKKYPTNFGERMLYYYQGKPFSGVATQGNAPDFKSIQHYKDGMMNGVSVSFYDDGQLKERSNWENGVRSGNYAMYYQNGQQMTKMYYRNGLPADTTMSWFKNGQLKSFEIIKNGQMYVDHATIYYENGNKQYEVRPTFYKKWYQDGTLQESANLISNKKDGKVKFYDESGKLFKTEFWENGELIKTKEKSKK